MSNYNFCAAKLYISQISSKFDRKNFVITQRKRTEKEKTHANCNESALKTHSFHIYEQYFCHNVY